MPRNGKLYDSATHALRLSIVASQRASERERWKEKEKREGEREGCRERGELGNSSRTRVQAKELGKFFADLFIYLFI